MNSAQTQQMIANLMRKVADICIDVFSLLQFYFKSNASLSHDVRNAGSRVLLRCSGSHALNLFLYSFGTQGSPEL